MRPLASVLALLACLCPPLHAADKKTNIVSSLPFGWDIGEQNNLIAKLPDIVARLKK
jgi:hypothetical protein